MKKNLFLVVFALFACSPDNDIEQSVNDPLDEPKLDAPKNVSGTVANGKITVTWDAVSNATSYKVSRSGDKNDFSQICTTQATSYTDNSPMSGSNYYRVQAFGANNMRSAMSAITLPLTTNPQEEPAQGTSGIFLGLIGFNQRLTNHPIKLLTEKSKQGYYDFIDAFNKNNDGTAVYYAVDQAITTLQGKTYPADLSSVHIITFTDGIDNCSLDIYDGVEFGKYSSPDECGDHVKSRLTTEEVAGQKIIGYAVGSRHSDVNSTRFTSTLNRIATSSSLVYELTDMSAVEAKFKEIAKNITEVNRTQNITVSIAGGLADGERIRFTFDLASSSTAPTNSGLYIEGTFERIDTSTRKIKITTCRGLEMADAEVVGIKNAKTGLFDFTFKDVTTQSKTLIDEKKTLEWWGNPWQMDDEFHPNENAKTDVITHSVAIILVLDCTHSLGDKFEQMKASAKSFITTLLDEAYSGKPGDGSDIVSENNGHKYVDLGLPSGLRWATVNVGVDVDRVEKREDTYGWYVPWGGLQAYSASGSASGTTNKDGSAYPERYYSGGSGGSILPIGRDVARKEWGGNWRMPTQAEWQELCNNCTVNKATISYLDATVWGIKFVSEIEGYTDRYIFLPAAGYQSNSSVYNAASCGYYWSSSCYSGMYDAYCMCFDSSDFNPQKYNYCNYGYSVRPVLPSDD